MLVRAALCLLIFCMSGAAVYAQETGTAPVVTPDVPAQTAHIRGTVRSEDDAPIAGARIQAHGPVDVTASSDATGTYDLQVPPGVYTIDVSAGSFESATQTALTVSGAGVNDDVTLSRPASGLKEIGRVATTSERSHFNTSPASIQSVSAQDFTDQGQTSIGRMLDEIPSISTPFTSNWAFGLVLPNESLTPQMRGAFSYETAQTLDGFPLLSATPNFGFDANMLTSTALEGIDVIKGPGADSPTINGAVGGTINYRMLNPTPTHKVTASVGTDGYGGTLWKLRDSGTIGRLGYVGAYSALNTPGYFNNVYSGPFVYMDYGMVVNGQKMTCYYIWYCNAYNEGTTVPNPQNARLSSTSTPWIMCCRSVTSSTNQFSEYAKLVYHLTPEGNPANATIELAYSGSQANTQTGGFNYYTTWDFLPPAGYTGSIAPGTYNLPAWNGDNSGVIQNQNVFEANFRSKIGPGFLRVGYMSLYQFDLNYDTGNANTNLGAGNDYTIWGGVPFGGTAANFPVASGASAPVPNWQIFNGTSALVSDQEYYTQGIYEHAHDWLVDYRVPIGPNSVDVSWTQASVNPDQGESYNLGMANAVPGDWDAWDAFNYNLLKQTNNEFRLTSMLQATPRLSALVSLYYDQYINYLSTKSAPSPLAANAATLIQQYAAGFQNYYNYALTPRVALAYQLNNDTSLRFSAGGALVPLPIGSLGGGGGSPTAGTDPNGNTIWKQSLAPMGIRPETSFGYDIGADVRLPKASMLVSTDLYTTTLWNQFMTVTQPVGTYQGLPLWTTQLANFGHSRYQGVELSVRRDVPKGFGFLVNGFLERGYPYDLPANFWTNPLTGAAQHLTFIPGANYNNGIYGGIGGGAEVAIPYAGGYGEISYRFGKNDSLVRFGAQFYGKNNTYFEPPFFVLSASLRYGFTPHLSLQLSADNLGNMYTSPFQGPGNATAFANVPAVPLYNGTQTSGYYVYVGKGSLLKLELTYK